MVDFLLIINRANNKNTKYVFACSNDKGVLSVVAFGTSFFNEHIIYGAKRRKL